MFEYFKEYFDLLSLVLCVALVAIGLVSIYSATYDAGAAMTFERQVYWAVIGLVVLLVMAFFPFRLLQRLVPPTYVVMLGILLVVLMLGKTVSGSRSWFGVGGLGIQPSEFAKVVTVLALAVFLSRTTVAISNPKHLVAAAAIVGVPTVFILLQPDVGTAIIFFMASIPVLYWAGASNFLLATIVSLVLAAVGALISTSVFLIAIAAAALLLYFTHTNRFAAVAVFGLTLAVGLSVQTIYDRLPLYQQKRIDTFLNPESDPLGAGYNVIQSKVAIGSGGVLGKGYLQGTQTQLNFIPEQWTDFIFCVPGEEFGLVGASAVLLLFAALAFRALKIATISKNRFGSIGAIGVLAVLMSHVLINVGMSLGLLPVIGVPLPFLSYGGSALIANMAMVGLLMNFYANRKEY